MSSVVTQLKSSINSVLFKINNGLFDGDSNFASNLYLCESEIKGFSNTRSNKIDPDSSKKLKELQKKIKEKIKELETKLSVSKGGESRDIKNRLKELKVALEELKVIIASDTNYKFGINSKPKLTYDGDSDTATVYYNDTIGSLMNELKHAFQFETGKIDFIKTNNSGAVDTTAGLLYDIGDELETYKRQYAYDGTLKLRVVTTEEEVLKQALSGKIKKGLEIGVLEIKKMSKITVDIIVKVEDRFGSGSLYGNISGRSLDINSPIKDIKKGNTNRPNLFNSLGLNEEKKDKAYIDFVKVFITSQPFIYVKD